MNQGAAKAESPFDGLDGTEHRDRAQSCLFHDLAQRRRVGALAALEMPFRKTPVAVAVTNQQKQRTSLGDTKYDASGRGFASRPSGAFATGSSPAAVRGAHT